MFAAVHNDLKVIAADIGNAYLHAKTTEKLYSILGDDYGELSGKVLLVFDACMYSEAQMPDFLNISVTSSKR